LEAQKPRPTCMMCSGLIVWLVEESVIAFPRRVRDEPLVEILPRKRGHRKQSDVRSWHKADMPIILSNVRFRGQSGHRLLHCTCLLLTQSGHPAMARLHGFA